MIGKKLDRGEGKERGRGKRKKEKRMVWDKSNSTTKDVHGLLM